MSEEKLKSLDQPFRDAIAALVVDLAIDGVNCAITSGRRTIAEQDKLYAQGRTAPGVIVTKARGGQSPHNFGEAVDLCPVHPETKKLWWDAPDDVWKLIAIRAIQHNLVPGYFWTNFQDRPHIESKTWREKQVAWKAGKLSVA